MEPRVIDVEVLKKKARKAAAGRVLTGGGADVCLELGELHGCRVCMRAGYGPQSAAPQVLEGDSLIWILEGYLDVQSGSGQVTRVSQGESTVLDAGSAYQLDFPTLTIYLSVEGTEAR